MRRLRESVRSHRTGAQAGATTQKTTRLETIRSDGLEIEDLLTGEMLPVFACEGCGNQYVLTEQARRLAPQPKRQPAWKQSDRMVLKSKTFLPAKCSQSLHAKAAGISTFSQNRRAGWRHNPKDNPPGNNQIGWS